MTKTRPNIFKTLGIFILLIVLVVAMTLLIHFRTTSEFITVSNLINIGRQCSVYALLAFGMTFVVISGGIDLSCSSILVLSGCVAALLMKNMDMNIWLASLIAVITGGVCGLINGFCIAKLRVPFFIATIGMMYAARGLANVITKETPVTSLPTEFNIFGSATTGLIPNQIIIMLIVLVICFIILNKTRLGRYTYAIGSNRLAAKQSGVNVDKYTMLIYTLCGVTAGIAGVIQSSRLRIGSPIIAQGWEMSAIAAVVIGGASMMGGSGNIIFSLVGALVLSVISTGLNMLGISTTTQSIVVGVIIVAVVAIDMATAKKGTD